MKKVELLSPAGNMVCLKMAVMCGADAVYVSGKEYGARKYAENFSMEELSFAIKYCHLYGVRLYVTVNTLVSEDDIDSFLDYIRKLHLLGVDALIMQDIGLMSYVKRKFPNLEIHASTQTHNCNNECISFLEGIGASRVVLARELSLDEIKEIDTDLELEVFIHGALCVSYSGQCLMSSKMFGRSGNRGECAGPCRFCYDLYRNEDRVKTNGNYLLSMKELCVQKNIGKLIEMGISSLKIEGRMKSKYYVGYVTRFYRMLIDKYYNGEELMFSDDEYKNLLVLYNREFTDGFLNNSLDIVNINSCNHQGVYLGEVVSLGKRIRIKLCDDLCQGDGVRFSNGEGMICNYIYDEKGLLVNKAQKGDCVYLDNKLFICEKGSVFKTLDVDLYKRIDNFIGKKIPVSFEVVANVDEEFSVSIICDGDKITKKLGFVQRANKVSVSEDDIFGKLSKLGDTPFVISDVNFSMDRDIFVPIKNVNILRRELVSELISLREKNRTVFLENDVIFDKFDINITNEISFLVRNEEQLKVLLNRNVNIYVEDYNLYKKYEYANIFYRPSRAGKNVGRISNALISNNGGFEVYSGKNVSDIYMNVINSLTLDVFSRYVYKVGISPEVSLDNIDKILSGYREKFGFLPNVEVLVYGRLELMIMKYCPIKSLVSKNNKCMSCFGSKYYLDDRNGHKFRLLGDYFHNMRVFDYENIDMLSDISYLRKMGVTNFRIDLLDEGEKDIENLLDKLKIDVL